MQQIKVEIVKMYPDVEIPKYQTEGSAGCDVRAYLPKDEFPDGVITISGGETKLIPTGIKVAIPDGYEMQVRPRSGLSLKTKLRVGNSPGTVDSDYHLPVGVILDNIAPSDIRNAIVITHGDRIAQLVFAPVMQAEFVEKDELSETGRKGGFGSTGQR